MSKFIFSFFYLNSKSRCRKNTNQNENSDERAFLEMIGMQFQLLLYKALTITGSVSCGVNVSVICFMVSSCDQSCLDRCFLWFCAISKQPTKDEAFSCCAGAVSAAYACGVAFLDEAHAKFKFDDAGEYKLYLPISH